jgi:hypothetical protein
MKSIARSYHRAFLVEPSKLTRLVTVVRERLQELDSDSDQLSEEYEVYLSGRKLIETNSLDQVLELDNSPRNEIERLSFTMNVTQGESTKPSDTVRIEFDGRSPASIDVEVRSDNGRWASDLFAQAEEQAERMMQTETMYKLAGFPEFAVFVLMGMCLMAISILLLVVAFSSDKMNPTELSSRMWLTPTDLVELDSLETSKPSNSNSAAEIMTRQLKNIRAAAQERSFINRLLTNWHNWFLALPVLVAIPCFFYLIARCYPAAVFCWGDGAERHARIVARRRHVWSVLVGFAIVEVLSNLFGLGLGGLISK